MTNQNLTFITGIIDRSGSMSAIRDEAQSGWNAFVGEQAAQPGECHIALVQFDDTIELVYDHVPAREITDYVLVPGGSTALLDAMGQAITGLGSKVNGMGEDARPGSVIVVVVTDGHENASREYTVKQINNMVKHQTDAYQWQFVFLGANMDAISAGQDVGVSAGRSMTYAADKIGSALGVASAKVARSRRARAAGDSALAAAALDWTEDERRALGEDS
jgi:Mg-chelatase subunit ChlD